MDESSDAPVPDTAGPFLSDRECPPRISPADGVDGILNMKPMKARGWVYVEVMDVRVVKVVVEGEERGCVLRTLVYLLYGTGLTLNVVCIEAGGPMRLPRSFCDVTRKLARSASNTQTRKENKQFMLAHGEYTLGSGWLSTWIGVEG
jgi:hypothetical protein